MRWAKNIDEAPRFIVNFFFIICTIMGLAIVFALLRSILDEPFLVFDKLVADSARIGKTFFQTTSLFLYSLIFQLGLAFFVTLWIRRVSTPLKALLIIPYATGVVAPAFSAYVFFSPALGPLDVNILGTEKGAAFVVAFIDAWQWTGILLLACFFKLEFVKDNETRFEQARLEGLSRFRIWMFIVWPAIREVIWLFLLVRALDWFRKADIIKALFGEGGPGYSVETIGRYIDRIYYFPQEGYAAILALLQMIILGLSVVIVFRGRLIRWLNNDAE